MRAPAFWSRPSGIAALISPLGYIYGAAGALRQRLVTSKSAPVPVICVGNLVAGGAGKTPVVQAIIRHLASLGIEAHCLSQGYGGKLKGPVRVTAGVHTADEVGDEPLLLARMAPTWVARDRVAGAAAAAAAGARIIVMDDGHQNPALRKSVSLVVIDGEYGFGNGRMIPAGPLREPVARGLARADAVVLLGEDNAGVSEKLPPRLPVLYASLRPAEDANRLEGESVLAFAGIGRPEKFFDTLRSLGCRIIGTRSFPDHHPYRYGEVKAIVDAAWAEGALPVTTEKDAVRLPPDLRPSVMTVDIEAVWKDRALFDRILGKAARHG